MDLNKFTERARGFVQAAQTIAMREEHQRMVPEHLLKALMDDDQGLAANLIGKSGGNAARVIEAVDLAVADDPLARQSAVEAAQEEAVKSRGRSTAGRPGQRGGNVKRRKK